MRLPVLPFQPQRRLFYMWLPPGKWYDDAISIPKTRLVEYQHRAMQTPGKLHYIWAGSADRARYLLRTDPGLRLQTYKRAKRAEKEMVKRVKTEPSTAIQMELFGSPLCGQIGGFIMSCVRTHPDGKCAEFMPTCSPLLCISESPKKPSFAEQIYKVGPPGVKYLEPLPHMLSGDIMTCNQWMLTTDNLIRCAQFEQTCQPAGSVCAGELSGDLWIKDLDLDKGAFTAKSKAAGFDVQDYADHVIENREDYDMRTFRQAVLARTFARIARGEYSDVGDFADGCRDKEGKFVPVPACRGGTVKKEKPKKPKKRIVAPPVEPVKKQNLIKSERMILDAIGTEIIHIDEISRKTGLRPYMVSSGLVMLELKGMVQQSAGKMFQTKKVTPEGSRLTDPWEMSGKEWRAAQKAADKVHAYDELVRLYFDAPPTLVLGKMPKVEHKAVVEKAYKEGKTVPQRVLDEYPEIGKEHRTPKELKAEGVWLMASPFTERQQDDYNRYTHYPIDFNEVFNKDVDQAQGEAVRTLKEYGIEKMPDAVRNEIDTYRKKLYEYYLAKFALQSYLPPPSVVGPAKWPAHKKAKAHQREKKMIDTIQKARRTMEKAITAATKGKVLVRTAKQWGELAINSTRIAFGNHYFKIKNSEDPKLGPFAKTVRKQGRDIHETLIRRAVGHGTPIPWEAIKTYPALQLKAIILRKPADAVVGYKKPHWSKLEKDADQSLLDALARNPMDLKELVSATGLTKSAILGAIVRLKARGSLKWSKEHKEANTIFTLSGLGSYPLAGDITHCALWAFDQTRGVYQCVAQGPSCEGQEQCVKPVLSPGRQSDIKRHKRILKDSIAAREKLNVRVGELRTRANRDFHNRLLRIGVNVAAGDRVIIENPEVKKIADSLLVGYQPRLDKFNSRLNAAQKHINRSNRVLTPKPRKKRTLRACVGWKKVWSDYYNAQVDRCARYKAACEAGVCLPEPIPRPALPEPSAQAVRARAEWMAEEQATPAEGVWIGKEIMKRSGLQNYRTRPGEKADPRYHEYVPIALRRKAGLTPDEMASELGLEGDNELYRLIQKAYPEYGAKGGKAGAAVRKRKRELKADWRYWKDDAFEEIQEELMKEL